MLEIKQLRTLLMIRECGNMADAAKRLHLTQSALSHQLKAIENLYGSPLFIRKSRPPQFTELGRRLLQLADELIPKVLIAEKDIGRILNGIAGRLHIVIECHSCFDWLMPTMDAYREDWPDIEMDLSLGFSFDPLPALLEGEIDLVITSDPIENKQITYHPLFKYQSVLVMHKEHRLVGQPYITAEQLATETLITYPVDRARLDVFNRYLSPAHIEPASIRTSELTSMIIQLVANKQGVAVLPSWAITKYLADNTVCSCKLNKDGVWATLYAAIRKAQNDTTYVRSFLDYAKTTSDQTLDNIIISNI